MDLRPVRLTFALGDIVLLRKTFSLMVQTNSLPDCETSTDPDTLWLQVPQGCAGMLLRSHPCAENVAPIERRSHILRYVPNQYERYFADLRGTFNDYMQTFSRKSRYNLRREVRKFEELSGVQPCWRVFRRPEEMEAFLAAALDVSARTYQERLLRVGLPNDDAFRNRTLELAGADAFRGYLLYHGRQPVSYMYCPITDGVIEYAYLGFDPAYRQWSPGKVLQYYAMENLFAEGGYRLFDFGLGEGEHKRLFATSSIRCADIYCLRPTMGHTFWIRLHYIVDHLSAGIGRLLAKIRLKAVVKRLLRRQM